MGLDSSEKVVKSFLEPFEGFLKNLGIDRTKLWIDFFL
jgi:hypothetical protein